MRRAWSSPGPTRRGTFSLRVPARRSSASTAAGCASASCSSSRSVARRRRAPILELVHGRSRARAGPRTASTSAPGSPARRARRRSRGGRLADGRPARRARRRRRPAPRSGSRGRSRPGSTGERRGRLAGSCSARTRGCPTSSATTFARPGLYHLLAVSGQNVVFVGRCVLVLAWLAGIARRCGEVAALAAIAAYVLAVGWQPSVVRAGVAGALASLAWLASRPRDRWYFLLARRGRPARVEPVPLLEPGFQLSFAAVGAIFVVVPRLERLARGLSACPRARRAWSPSRVACGARDRADPLAPVRRRAALLGAGERARRARDRAPLLGLGLAGAALDAGRCPSAALALAWLNGWLAAYVAGVRAARRRPAVRADQVADARLCCSSRTPLAGRRCSRGCRAGARACGARGRRARGRRRCSAGSSAPAGRLPPPPRRPDHGARRRPGRRDPRPGAAGRACSSTRARPRRASPSSSAARACDGSRCSSSRTRSATTSAARAEVLARLGVERVLDPRLPSPSPTRTQRCAMAARSSRAGRHGPSRRSVAARPSPRPRCSGRTGPGVPGDDPNNHAVVLLASYGEVDVLLTADAETDVTAPLRPPRSRS